MSFTEENLPQTVSTQGVESSQGLGVEGPHRQISSVISFDLKGSEYCNSLIFSLLRNMQKSVFTILF